MTNLQYAIMEAYRDNLLSPDVTMDMLEAAQARLGPNGMTDSYLKEVKKFEDEVVAPAKNSNWWTSEHTSKVNTYLRRIKTIFIGRSAADEDYNNDSDGDAGHAALAGLRIAISYELPANKFKFIINHKDLTAYNQEAYEIKKEKDHLMKLAKGDYDREVELYDRFKKKRGYIPHDLKDYEDELKLLNKDQDKAKKKLASVYGVRIA